MGATITASIIAKDNAYIIFICLVVVFVAAMLSSLFVSEDLRRSQEDAQMRAAEAKSECSNILYSRGSAIGGSLIEEDVDEE